MGVGQVGVLLMGIMVVGVLLGLAWLAERVLR